jgi:CHASE2 domain-containing sensor protein
MPLRWRLRHPAWRGVLLGLFCALLVWVVFRSSGLLHGVEDWMLDGCFFYRGEQATRARVVLIGIDDATLAELRKPLSFLSPELAAVVRHVHQQGASAIGLDLVVPNDLRDRPEFARGGEGDPRPLGQAVADAGNVVLAEWWDGDRLQTPLVFWRLKSLTAPDPRDLGFINLTADRDQILRRQRLLAPGEQVVPSFALALYARSRGQSFRWDDDNRELHVGDEVIPLDEKQRLRINFAGPPGRFETLSFRDVLKDAKEGQPLPQLQGAVVLIGVTARGGQDVHATPYANHYANYGIVSRRNFCS